MAERVSQAMCEVRFKDDRAPIVSTLDADAAIVKLVETVAFATDAGIPLEHLVVAFPTQAGYETARYDEIDSVTPAPPIPTVPAGPRAALRS